MAQIDSTLYMNIAYDFHLAKESMAAVSAFLQEAVYEIVDVTTGGYSAGSAAAAAIELELLRPFNSAYNAMDSVMNSDSPMLEAVRTINNFVIANHATGDLKAFLNGLNWTSVTNLDCIPAYWCTLSESAGYSTDGWKCCTVS